MRLAHEAPCVQKQQPLTFTMQKQPPLFSHPTELMLQTPQAPFAGSWSTKSLHVLLCLLCTLAKAGDPRLLRTGAVHAIAPAIPTFLSIFRREILASESILHLLPPDSKAPRSILPSAPE